MIRALLATFASTTVIMTTGCTDATGSVQGGDSLTPEAATEESGPSDDAGTGGEASATWTSLYADFFGGLAACSANGSCHGAPGDFGSGYSGFVCGLTKDECYQGLTGDPSPILPLEAGDIKNTVFWLSLHKQSGGGSNNMPCGLPDSCPANMSTYAFTDGDLQRITTWYQQGGLNN
jgi:hypothetical protein